MIKKERTNLFIGNISNYLKFKKLNKGSLIFLNKHSANLKIAQRLINGSYIKNNPSMMQCHIKNYHSEIYLVIDKPKNDKLEKIVETELIEKGSSLPTYKQDQLNKSLQNPIDIKHINFELALMIVLDNQQFQLSKTKDSQDTVVFQTKKLFFLLGKLSVTKLISFTKLYINQSNNKQNQLIQMKTDFAQYGTTGSPKCQRRISYH
ncbi:hypothetical protein ABPG72_001587 [Tetrahymena utriculariae]